MRELPECRACPRLVALREEVRDAHPDYHAAPVPAWGSQRARLLIVGLAPGMHGANRTGRPFTGDDSGRFLFQALYEAGFASSPQASDARLIDTRITNAVKCLPPGNRPLAAELASCRSYLASEIDTLTGPAPRRPRCILCLGRVAHGAVVTAVKEVMAAGVLTSRNPESPAFRHGGNLAVADNLWLVDSYHPSRLNTNTGRLTMAMLDQVLAEVRILLEG